jgi:hypothetical protein
VDFTSKRVKFALDAVESLLQARSAVRRAAAIGSSAGSTTRVRAHAWAVEASDSTHLRTAESTAAETESTRSLRAAAEAAESARSGRASPSGAESASAEPEAAWSKPAEALLRRSGRCRTPRNTLAWWREPRFQCPQTIVQRLQIGSQVSDLVAQTRTLAAPAGSAAARSPLCPRRGRRQRQHTNGQAAHNSSHFWSPRS